MGFDFDRISSTISSYMDTDLLDITRYAEGAKEASIVASNVPCHIEICSADNPEPLAVDVLPVVSSLRVHMPTSVDVQNGDYLIAKKMSSPGDVLIAYRGVCGHPAVDQARQYITLVMQTDGA